MSEESVKTSETARTDTSSNTGNSQKRNENTIDNSSISSKTSNSGNSKNTKSSRSNSYLRPVYISLGLSDAARMSVISQGRRTGSVDAPNRINSDIFKHARDGNASGILQMLNSGVKVNVQDASNQVNHTNLLAVLFTLINYLFYLRIIHRLCTHVRMVSMS